MSSPGPRLPVRAARPEHSTAGVRGAGRGPPEQALSPRARDRNQRLLCNLDPSRGGLVASPQQRIR